MLVLTRRIGEKIVIDGVITVTVMAIQGDKARLGVNAPLSARVDRSEIHDRRHASRHEDEASRRTVQQGDRVRVDYMKRLQDGTNVSSREPLELTVGSEHPCLPGLGAALVGLSTGQAATLTVPPEKAYGLPDPARIHHWSRQRFPKETALQAGKLVRFTPQRDRRRLVRIVEVNSKSVVVDANHPWAGQILEMEVKLIAFLEPQSRSREKTAEQRSQDDRINA